MMDILLEAIAKRHLRIPTLRSRGRDSLDFHEFSVSTLERALQAALDLGKAIGKSEAGGHAETWGIRCTRDNNSLLGAAGPVWMRDDTSPDGFMHFDSEDAALQYLQERQFNSSNVRWRISHF